MEFDEVLHTLNGRSKTSEAMYTLDCLFDTRTRPQMEDIMHIKGATLAIYFLALWIMRQGYVLYYAIEVYVSLLFLYLK